MRQPEAIEAMLDTPAAAKALKLNERTLRRWRKTGIGPAWIEYPHGKRIKYRLSDLEAWLQKRTRCGVTRWRG